MRSFDLFWDKYPKKVKRKRRGNYGRSCGQVPHWRLSSWLLWSVRSAVTVGSGMAVNTYRTPPRGSTAAGGRTNCFPAEPERPTPPDDARRGGACERDQAGCHSLPAAARRSGGRAGLHADRPGYRAGGAGAGCGTRTLRKRSTGWYSRPSRPGFGPDRLLTLSWSGRLWGRCGQPMDLDLAGADGCHDHGGSCG